MTNRLTPEEQAVLAKCRLWRASPSHRNRVHLDRAIDAYNRSLRLLEDEKNEAINRLLLGVRRVA